MAKITRDVLKVVNDDINKIKPQPIRSKSLMDTINADIANMNAGKSLQHYSPTPSSTPSPTYSPSPTQSTPMPTVSGLDASM